MQEFTKKVFYKIKQFIRDDETQFRFVTASKMAIIPFFTFATLIIFILILLKLNLIFFESYGYPNIAQLKDTFYTYILSILVDLVPYLMGFLGFLLLAGFYVSELMLRPFKAIGNYCEKFLQEEKPIYDPDFFSDLKMLTTFSEYFFNMMENSSKNKKFLKIDIPPKYTKIHAPVFESAFFIQFAALLIMTSIIVGSAIHIAVSKIYNELIQLSLETLKQDKVVSYFLVEQQELLVTISIVALVIHVALYLFLSLNLYSKVSIPAFGIFATMRSFIKGNYSSRVHLLGHYFVRPYCRRLNAYLDLLEELSANSQEFKK